MLSLSIPPEVNVVAVSKGQSLEKIKDAIKNNIFTFGENYLQEALTKIDSLKNKKLEWHFIGHIQSNKTREIARYFDWVQSVDRKKIATQLYHHRPIDKPPLNICIEINDREAENKSGITLAELPDFIEHLKTLPRLKWRGLMTMVTEDYEKVSHAFYDLKKQGYDIDTLSMGMSYDYQQAIQLGATMVRIGTAIFGERTA